MVLVRPVCSSLAIHILSNDRRKNTNQVLSYWLNHLYPPSSSLAILDLHVQSRVSGVVFAGTSQMQTCTEHAPPLLVSRGGTGGRTRSRAVDLRSLRNTFQSFYGRNSRSPLLFACTISSKTAVPSVSSHNISFPLFAFTDVSLGAVEQKMNRIYYN